MKKFWIVIRDSAGSIAPVPYESQEAAIKEAERLAKENPKESYHVMESIGVAETPKAVYTSYEPSTTPVRGMDQSEIDQLYKAFDWPVFNMPSIGPGLREKP